MFSPHVLRLGKDAWSTARCCMLSPAASASWRSGALRSSFLAMAWNTLYQWIGYGGARAWDEHRLQISVQKQRHRSRASEREDGKMQGSMRWQQKTGEANMKTKKFDIRIHDFGLKQTGFGRRKATRLRVSVDVVTTLLIRVRWHQAIWLHASLSMACEACHRLAFPTLLLLFLDLVHPK